MEDNNYVDFKAGDITHLKGPHIFQGEEMKIIPSMSEVKVLERNVDWRLVAAKPHVVVAYRDGSGAWQSSNWIEEDCLMPLGPTPEELEAAIQSIKEA